MTKLPPALRLASLLPAPFALSDYEPFAAVGGGAFGTSTLKDVTTKTLDEVRAAMQKAFAKGATAGWSPVERVRAVFFDLDATTVAEESLVELAATVGKDELMARETERAMRGDIDYATSFKARMALLKDVPVATVSQVADRLTLNKGIQPFVAFCRELGVPCFLVTGGLARVAEVVRRKVGFDAFIASVGEESDDKLTGGVAGAVLDAEGKRRFVAETCARLGFTPADAAAVGDGANDLLMLQAVGVAVGFKPKKALLPHLHALNSAGNHAFLGPLLFGRDISITRSRVRTT